ncbi:hypothetical protein BB561_001685 [Smittium simulii]|uniref:Uncharacterized protein n=1 Tax=Smittium simulii TaxID=133385 RepID=A0A2T9YTI7_9FUNG|nr:hypothetical protein BB561_001685 [Smittium simulii]
MSATRSTRKKRTALINELDSTQHLFYNEQGHNIANTPKRTRKAKNLDKDTQNPSLLPDSSSNLESVSPNSLSTSDISQNDLLNKNSHDSSKTLLNSLTNDQALLDQEKLIKPNSSKTRTIKLKSSVILKKMNQIKQRQSENISENNSENSNNINDNSLENDFDKSGPTLETQLDQQSSDESTDNDEPLILSSLISNGSKSRLLNSEHLLKASETPAKSKSLPKSRLKSGSTAKLQILQVSDSDIANEPLIASTSKKSKKRKVNSKSQLQQIKKLDTPSKTSIQESSSQLNLNIDSNLIPLQDNKNSQVDNNKSNNSKNFSNKQKKNSIDTQLSTQVQSNVEKSNDLSVNSETEVDPVIVIDEDGEKKIDKDGNLIGERSFVIPTFTLPSEKNPSAKYMLLTHIMKFAGFRDTNHMQRLYPNLKKIEATPEQRDFLLDESWIYVTRKRLPAFVISAYHAFREFGSKIIVRGKYIVDDYYEKKSREEKLHEYGTIIGGKSLGLRKFTSATNIIEESRLDSPTPLKQKNPGSNKTKENNDKYQLDLADISNQPYIVSLVDFPPKTNLNDLVPASTSSLQKFTSNLFDESFTLRKPISDNIVLGEANHLALLNALQLMSLPTNKYHDFLKPTIPNLLIEDDSENSLEKQIKVLNKHGYNAKISSNQTVIANRSLLQLRAATKGIFYDPHTNTTHLPSLLQPFRATVKRNIHDNLSILKSPTSIFDFSFKNSTKANTKEDITLNKDIPYVINYSDLNCCSSIQALGSSLIKDIPDLNRSYIDPIRDSVSYNNIDLKLDLKSDLAIQIDSAKGYNTDKVILNKNRHGIFKKYRIKSEFPLALTLDQRQDIFSYYQTRFGKSVEDSKLLTKNLLVKSFWDSIITSTANTSAVGTSASPYSANHLHKKSTGSNLLANPQLQSQSTNNINYTQNRQQLYVKPQQPKKSNSSLQYEQQLEFQNQINNPKILDQNLTLNKTYNQQNTFKGFPISSPASVSKVAYSTPDLQMSSPGHNSNLDLLQSQKLKKFSSDRLQEYKDPRISALQHRPNNIVPGKLVFHNDNLNDDGIE